MIERTSPGNLIRYHNCPLLRRTKSIHTLLKVQHEHIVPVDAMTRLPRLVVGIHVDEIVSVCERRELRDEAVREVVLFVVGRVSAAVFRFWVGRGE